MKIGEFGATEILSGGGGRLVTLGQGHFVNLLFVILP